MKPHTDLNSFCISCLNIEVYSHKLDCRCENTFLPLSLLVTRLVILVKFVVWKSCFWGSTPYAWDLNVNICSGDYILDSYTTYVAKIEIQYEKRGLCNEFDLIQCVVVCRYICIIDLVKPHHHRVPGLRVLIHSYNGTHTFVPV